MASEKNCREERGDNRSMTKVIEWVGAREGDIVWKYPIEEIQWFDHLIVHEHEAAVFFRDGKAFDVFRAGRHILSTQNIPKITKILTKIAGFDKTPFRATIVFVSLKKFQGSLEHKVKPRIRTDQILWWVLVQSRRT